MTSASALIIFFVHRLLQLSPIYYHCLFVIFCSFGASGRQYIVMCPFLGKVYYIVIVSVHQPLLKRGLLLKERIHHEITHIYIYIYIYIVLTPLNPTF